MECICARMYVIEWLCWLPTYMAFLLLLLKSNAPEPQRSAPHTRTAGGRTDAAWGASVRSAQSLRAGLVPERCRTNGAVLCFDSACHLLEFMKRNYVWVAFFRGMLLLVLLAIGGGDGGIHLSTTNHHVRTDVGSLVRCCTCRLHPHARTIHNVHHIHG